MNWPRALLLAAGVGLARAAAAMPDDVPDRLFDFAPVGPGNPWVARLDGTEEIPVSELRAYAAAQRGGADPAALAPDARRALIADLVDEYLLVRAARAAGADTSPAFAGRMAHTRRMLLAELLVGREVGAVARTPEDYAARLQRLRDAVFDACPIEVSNEAHARLVAALEPAGRALAARDGRAFAAETARLGSLVLARYPGGVVEARKLLVFALAVPESERPDAAQPAGLTQLLKELLLPELLADAARARGIEATREFRAKVIENENSLRRLFARDELLQETRRRSAVPAEAEVAAWFQAQRAHYGAGVELAAVRARVESDLVEERCAQARAALLATLRRAHRIEIRDAAVAAEAGS